LGIVVSAFLVTAFGITASALNSIYPLMFGVAVALAFYLWRVHRIQLEPLSLELVSRAKKSEGVNIIILLFSLFLN
jgi:hypothetical protein